MPWPPAACCRCRPTDSRTDNEAADFAALAAAYLNDNLASGQAATVASQLLDGNFANGELTFQNDDGTTCINICRQLELTPPQAYVDFGLAGAISPGTNVTAQRVRPCVLRAAAARGHRPVLAPVRLRLRPGRRGHHQRSRPRAARRSAARGCPRPWLRSRLRWRRS